VLPGLPPRETTQYRQRESGSNLHAVRWKLITIIALALLMSAAVLLHVPGLNGAWYHLWRYWRLAWWIYPLILAGATPFFIGQWLYASGRARGRAGVVIAIALAMLSTFALQILIMLPQPLGFGRIVTMVENPTNTSYYNVSHVLLRGMHQQGMTMRDWMEIYPDLMPTMMLHASFKPPGWILYYMAVLDQFESRKSAALAGALGVALLAAAGIPATYRLARAYGLDEAQSFSAASFFALIPSLILFFPQGDQAYPLLACFLLVSWAAALQRDRWWYPAIFGALLAFALFFSAVFLMLGLFLAVHTLLYIADRGGKGLLHASVAAAIAIGSVIALYGLLWIFTGFDPIATFQMSAARSQAHLVELHRPWPLHSALDVLDIALGTGWISVPLIIFGALTAWRTWDWHQPQFRVVFIGLLQIVMAIAVAVFPGENARLMLPLMPLLMLPIGIELGRWKPAARIATYAALLLVLAVLAQNMNFLYLGEEIDHLPR
jgi:hypothetical protein